MKFGALLIPPGTLSSNCLGRCARGASAILYWQETIVALLVLGDTFHAAHVVAVHKLRKRLGWDLSSAISFESASSPSKMHVTLTREHLNVDMRL